MTSVSFLYDDSYLVSTGGKDMSVMQWRIVWGRKTETVTDSFCTAAGGPDIQLKPTELTCTKTEPNQTHINSEAEDKSGSDWTEVIWQNEEPKEVPVPDLHLDPKKDGLLEV